MCPLPVPANTFTLKNSSRSGSATLLLVLFRKIVAINSFQGSRKKHRKFALKGFDF